MKELILIIEDEIEICEDLVKILKLSDYDTLFAHDGVEGLKLALAHIPDLIISDIMIPKLNGYELLRKLQNEPETASIPFLFLSAKSNKFDLREAMNLGADDFITKPYDIDELLNTIRVRLDKRKQRESHLTKKIENLQTNLRKTMPHEIRTPLNVILGFSEFLMKNKKLVHEVEALDMIQNIHESGQRLLRTFENYLLYANLELISATQSEKHKFQKYKTYMADVYLRDVAQGKAIEYDREQDLLIMLIDATVHVYEDHFKTMTEELLDNSFKFSKVGTTVKLSSSYDDGTYTMVFSDEGRGMTDEHISKLGDFVQFDRKMYEQQGNGLGLSIVKRIVDIYNGSFSINSVPDKFTEITIKLPGTGSSY
jgi:two-component system, sensor histidine kinase and response regulator